MTTLLTIGEFSRLTHVSVKALRHYQDVGLLAPADVDPGSGYRLYAAAQAPSAQLIRRFREMDMPLDTIKAILSAEDRAERDTLIVGHLQRMERQLEQTQVTVAALRALIEGSGRPAAVEHRTLPDCPSLTATAVIAWDDTPTWLEDTFSDLRRRLRDHGRAGPDGALYSSEFFEEHHGRVTAFIPVLAATADEIAGGSVAIAVHRGSFSELDRVYAALGAYVAERGIGMAGPIREHYLVSAFDDAADEEMVTEVCWPAATHSA